MKIKSLILGSIVAAALVSFGASSVMAADSLSWSSPSPLMITAPPAATADFQGAITKGKYFDHVTIIGANDPLGSAGIWGKTLKMTSVGYSIQALPLGSPITSKETVGIGMIAAVTNIGPSSCAFAGETDRVFYGDSSGPLGHDMAIGASGWTGSGAIPAPGCLKIGLDQAPSSDT